MWSVQIKQRSWQQQRHFAETAVAPKFDWDSLETSVASEEGKRDLASLRSTWIDVQQKFESMSQASYLKDIDQSCSCSAAHHHVHRLLSYGICYAVIW